jgi:hypothetical protein
MTPGPLVRLDQAPGLRIVRRLEEIGSLPANQPATLLKIVDTSLCGATSR